MEPLTWKTGIFVRSFLELFMNNIPQHAHFSLQPRLILVYNKQPPKFKDQISNFKWSYISTCVWPIFLGKWGKPDNFFQIYF